MYLAHKSPTFEHSEFLLKQEVLAKNWTKLFPKNWMFLQMVKTLWTWRDCNAVNNLALNTKKKKQFLVIGVLLQCWLLATPKQRSRTNNFRENVIIFLWFENFYFEGWACYRAFIILKSILTEKSIYRRRAACAWELRFQKYLYMSFFFNFCNVWSSNYKSNII